MKAKKMSRRQWFWIIGFFVLEVVGLLWVGRDLLVRLSSEKSGNLYVDPQVRFIMQVDPNWEEVETDEPMVQKQVNSQAGNLPAAVVMDDSNDYQSDRINEGLVSTWMHEK
ncbi:MAG: hypothetical protein ACM3PY_16995 [Omnitrophica WOR_2 bacterium]